MFKVKGLGKRLVFVRYKLWAIVCKAVERDAVACEVESRFPVAKVVPISPDSIDIEDRLVVFGHRASGKVMLKLQYM